MECLGLNPTTPTSPDAGTWDAFVFLKLALTRGRFQWVGNHTPNQTKFEISIFSDILSCEDLHAIPEIATEVATPLFTDASRIIWPASSYVCRLARALKHTPKKMLVATLKFLLFGKGTQSRSQKGLLGEFHKKGLRGRISQKVYLEPKWLRWIYTIFSVVMTIPHIF